MARRLWVDASAGVAGDMLLAALVDAGADLEVVRRAVAAVLPEEVRLATTAVTRAGIAALRLVVEHDGRSPSRSWADIRALLGSAEVDEPVREGALTTFALLAEVEAAAHGVRVDEVHFHEVGAWDSVADVVGVCAALAELGVCGLASGPVGLGSGTVRTEHGTMPVPVPAVLGVLTRSELEAAADDSLQGECATPTGVALLAALGTGPVPSPSGRILAVGTGAGARDTPGRANVTRVVLHEEAAAGAGPDSGAGRTSGTGDLQEQVLVELSATVDDLDPRAWPLVLEVLLAHGALDAWLTPVLMKKGRPGHVVSVLAEPGKQGRRMVDLLLEHTSTLGVRSHEVHRWALERRWEQVELPDGQGVARVKLGLRGDRIVSATPEFEDARAITERTGRPLRQVLRQLEVAAAARGWVIGEENQPPG